MAKTGRRRWRRRLLGLGLLIALLLFEGCGMIMMPGRSYRGPLAPVTEAEADKAEFLRGVVEHLAGTIGERNDRHPAALEAARAYIEQVFREGGYVVAVEAYDARGQRFSNIVAERRGKDRPEEIVVIGAHYDSAPGSPGANDNASGVSAMLALSRDLVDEQPARSLRLIAFANEEPPWFQGPDMGSRVHVRACAARGERIVAMLSLETMGWYDDAPGSQVYPFPFSLCYPDTGNFIGFVGNRASRALVRQVVGAFRRHAAFPSEGVSAPGWITGIGWSDHWSFWRHGYPALMVTDTAPFRYPYYHTREDTPDKLDYQRLARVVAGLGPVVRELLGSSAR